MRHRRRAVVSHVRDDLGGYEVKMLENAYIRNQMFAGVLMSARLSSFKTTLVTSKIRHFKLLGVNFIYFLALRYWAVPESRAYKRTSKMLSILNAARTNKMGR